MKKRILIFSLVYYPRYVGGAEVAIKEITDRLEEFEWDMVTLQTEKDQPIFERIGRINIYRVGFGGISRLNKYLMIWTAWRKAIKLHKMHSYDMFWSMMATYNSFAALLFKFSFPQLPFLLTLQEGDPISYIKKRARPLWFLFKRIFTQADYIQVISNYLGDFAREMKAKCPIEVVPNGVDVKHFSQHYDIEKTNGQINLITTSRLVKKNAVGDIIESLQYLPKNYKLQICGTGYEESDLKYKSRKLLLEERVEFLGFIGHNELPRYLKAADIFVRPALSEGFGNSYIEAMAARIPVIATPVGGIIDFLKDRETGLFCEVSNPKSIANKVLELTSDPNLKNHLVDTAFDMVKAEYDWDLIAIKMKGIFEKL